MKSEDLLLTHVAERDIDLLILEEFCCSDVFRRWFLLQIEELKRDFKSFKFLAARHSVSGLGKGAGETDLCVDFMINDEKVRLLIENKIDACFTKNQPARYSKRLMQYIKNEFDKCYCILLAPERYCKKWTLETGQWLKWIS